MFVGMSGRLLPSALGALWACCSSVRKCARTGAREPLLDGASDADADAPAGADAPPPVDGRLPVRGLKGLLVVGAPTVRCRRGLAPWPFPRAEPPRTPGGPAAC